jgi:hypothetical protein
MDVHKNARVGPNQVGIRHYAAGVPELASDDGPGTR